MYKIKVSIIMPVYNGEKYVNKSIKSVLDQNFKDFELIVINDGSTDSTLEKIKLFLDVRIKVINNNTNLGIQKSLNIGLKKAKGDYIARIDADDIWINKNKLKKQIDFMENNTDYILCGTGAICVDSKGEEIFRYFKPKSDKDIRNTILSRNCFIHSSVLFRKEIGINLGGYSEDIKYKHIEDYELWLRMGLIGKMYNFSDHDIMYTIHKDSISSKNKVEQLKKSIRVSKVYKNKYPRKIINFIRNTVKLIYYSFFNR